MNPKGTRTPTLSILVFHVQIQIKSFENHIVLPYFKLLSLQVKMSNWKEIMYNPSFVLIFKTTRPRDSFNCLF